MINFKYLTFVLKADLLCTTGNIIKSIFLTDEEFSYLDSKKCFVSAISQENKKYLVEVDRERLLALCS